MTKAILVDDEKLAIKVLEEMLKKYENIEIVATYTDPIEAIKELKNTKPDVVFLDIEMGKHNGINLADRFLCNDCFIDIVFVTAFSEYAIEAFELNAIDYLLKPVTPQRLAKAIERITNNQDKQPEKQSLYIQSLGNFTLFDQKGNPISWRTEKSKELFAFLWAHQEETVLRGVLIEILFPDRDADKANTLFSTTLYQTRKNANQYLEENFVKQANRGYIFNVDIESDVSNLNKIIDSANNDIDAFKQIKDIYQYDFLELEDYIWKSSIEYRLRTKVKNKVAKIYRALNPENISIQTQEEVLIFLYKIDRLDEYIYQDVLEFYQSTNQQLKKEKFKQEHNTFLKHELGIET